MIVVTVNTHKLINKLIHTNIPNTITEFIANYIKGHEAYKTFKNTTYIHNTNSKITSTGEAFFNPHTSTFTSQTYTPPNLYNPCI